MALDESCNSGWIIQIKSPHEMGDWAIVARESNAESDRSVKIFAVRSLSEIMTEGVTVSTIVISGGDWEGMGGTQAASAANNNKKDRFNKSGDGF